MLLLTTCRRTLRRASLVSALSAGLLAPPLLSSALFAQQPAAYQPRLLPFQEQARPLGQSSSTLLPPAPVSGVSGEDSGGRNVIHPEAVERLAPYRLIPQQQVGQQQVGLQPPDYQQMQHTQYADPAEKPSLFSRILRTFRKDPIPSGPPRDPGMSYPRGNAATPQNTAQQSQSSDSKQGDTLIPPDWNRGVVAQPQSILVPPKVDGAKGTEMIIPPPAYSGSIAGEVPGQRTASLEPGGNFLVPPSVDGGKVAPAPPAETASQNGSLLQAPPAATPPKVAGIPLGDAPAAGKTAARSDLPVFNLDSPEPATDAEPEENMDLLLLPAPASTASADTATATPAPDAGPGTPAMPADPLAGTFSEKAPAATTTQAEAPYTGLSLEEDLFVAPVPRTETPKVATPMQAPAPPAEDSLVIAEESSPMLPPIPVNESAAAVAPTAQPDKQSSSEPISLPGASTAAKSPSSGPMVEAHSVDAPSIEAPSAQAPKVAASQAEQPEPPAAAAPGKPSSPSDPNKSKLELIHSRPGSGLKGFCAVALQNERELKDVREEFSALFHGRLYSFSSEQALETFLADPARYAPASRGNDVIHLALTGEEVEGSLDHAVWYQGRLYLFTSAETMETFTAAPSSHATTE